MPESLKPLFKWTGGKRREIPQFEAHLPAFVTDGSEYTFVEPFVGAGAVFWHLGCPRSVINDYDGDVINFYRHVATQDERFLREVETVAALFDVNPPDRDAQAAAFYRLRDLDRNGGLATVPDWQRAARFFVVNQLAFSGMRRFNSNGEFNVPFGHYKNFNASALRSRRHVDLLKATTILHGDYAQVVRDHDKPETFMFIDPPYTRVMKTYSAGATFGDEQQRELAAVLLGLEHAKFMVVIDRSELTEELYGDHIAASYELNYGVNIRNRFSQAAEHIVVCNYPTGALAGKAA
jgi:DNA adenine methylase